MVLPKIYVILFIPYVSTSNRYVIQVKFDRRRRRVAKYTTHNNPPSSSIVLRACKRTRLADQIHPFWLPIIPSRMNRSCITNSLNHPIFIILYLIAYCHPPPSCASFVKPILRYYSHRGPHKTSSSIWIFPIIPFFRPRKQYDCHSFMGGERCVELVRFRRCTKSDMIHIQCD